MTAGFAGLPADGRKSAQGLGEKRKREADGDQDITSAKKGKQIATADAESGLSEDSDDVIMLE